MSTGKRRIMNNRTRQTTTPVSGFASKTINLSKTIGVTGNNLLVTTNSDENSSNNQLKKISIPLSDVKSRLGQQINEIEIESVKILDSESERSPPRDEQKDQKVGIQPLPVSKKPTTNKVSSRFVGKSQRNLQKKPQLFRRE